VHRVESGDGGCPQEDEIGDLKMTTARVLWSRSEISRIRCCSVDYNQSQNLGVWVGSRDLYPRSPP